MGKVFHIIWFGLILNSLGCTFARSISQTNIPQDRKHPIKVVNEKLIFFMLNFDNDQAFKLTEKLRKACPRGAVQGVLTKDLVTMYFLFFVWAEVTRVEAYCVNPPKNIAQEDGPLPDELAAEL
jgi:hypothetical protein